MGSYSEVEFVERGPSFTLRFHWMYCWHNIIYAGKEEIDKFYTSKKGIQFIIRHRVFWIREIKWRIVNKFVFFVRNV